jgi:hypothetical protein
MEEEARVCITNARGLVIDGRPIRVEHAKAQREYNHPLLLFCRKLCLSFSVHCFYAELHRGLVPCHIGSSFSR